MPTQQPGGRRRSGAANHARAKPPEQATAKFVFWQEQGQWFGYFQDYPDYWTQAKSLVQLKEMLKDLYSDLTSGAIPGIRKVDELVVS